jgi:hypothetical protein
MTGPESESKPAKGFVGLGHQPLVVLEKQATRVVEADGPIVVVEQRAVGLRSRSRSFEYSTHA